jgi:hypothetical protein
VAVISIKPKRLSNPSLWFIVFRLMIIQYPIYWQAYTVIRAFEGVGDDQSQPKDIGWAGGLLG